MFLGDFFEERAMDDRQIRSLCSLFGAREVRDAAMAALAGQDRVADVLDLPTNRAGLQHVVHAASLLMDGADASETGREAVAS
ncbi:MAG: hypothetical protein JNN18_18515 [Rubrivivax sp.]|nr:hypothetical protein [Rubrivivax sp.]